MTHADKLPDIFKVKVVNDDLELAKSVFSKIMHGLYAQELETQWAVEFGERALKKYDVD
jgi:hypothetical protein